LHIPFPFSTHRIAVLTGAVRRSSRRSLVDRCAVSGQAPGSGARRQGQELDEVGTAILGGAAAENVKLSGKYHDESFPAKYQMKTSVNLQGKGFRTVVFVSSNGWLYFIFLF
jgi:hypothetical protein